MSEKSRAWWQIHLSTAVVLLVVAAALVTANFSGRHGVEIYDSPKVDFGWPGDAVTLHEDGSITNSEHASSVNVVVAILSLAVAGGVCELWIRGNGQRKRLFRVHLSTAFFAMLLAAALLGVNIKEAGWLIEYRQHALNGAQTVCLDFLISVEFVLCLTVLLEGLIRRREARKEVSK